MLLVLLAAPLLLGVTPEPFEQTELIRDVTFQNGFQVKNNETLAITGELRNRVFDQQPAPNWILEQWHSRGVIDASDHGQPCADEGSRGNWCWANRYKKIAIGPDGLMLSVDSVAEWDRRYRRDLSPLFPHLLLEQTFAHEHEDRPSIADMRALNMSLSFALENSEPLNEVSEGYDPNKHATQFLVYVTVQNLRSAPGEGYGEYVWFGIPLYDDRFQFVEQGRHIDEYTRRLIWSVGQKEFMRRSIHDERSQRIAYDILPQVTEALDYAYRHGLLKQKDPSYYKIGGVNVGFEMPGMSKTSFRLRQLSLKADHRRLQSPTKLADNAHRG